MNLTRDEIEVAYRAGVRRSQAGRRRNGTHRFGWKPDKEQQRHTDGMSAIAECEVAAQLGRKWLSDGIGPDDPNAGDVDGGISVRWTDRWNGSLIVHGDEPQHHVAVLVVGDDPERLRVVGWAWVATAQEERWLRTNVRHPAYFLPQHQLRPISELKSMLETTPF